ncbi:MAG: restriction endonuclease [Methylotenera sp.]
MARRKKGDLLEELSTIPWWINVILAVVVYFSLKYILPSINFKSQIHQAFASAISGFSGIFAILVLVAALMSFFNQLKRKKLLNDTDKLESIRQLSWQEFELLIGEYFRRKGYAVRENGGGGADGGIDLTLTKNNQKTIVQCKRWKNVQVGVSPVRELYGVMVAEKASACIFVSSGNYTQEAQSFANNKPIELINGETLYKLISEVRSTKKSVHASVNTEKVTTQASIICPKCGGGMVERVAKRGQNTGKKFYGCSNYPSCTGTIG